MSPWVLHKNNLLKLLLLTKNRVPEGGLLNNYLIVHFPTCTA